MIPNFSEAAFEAISFKTCFIYFDEKKQSLEKTIQKMKEKYLKKGNVELKQVEGDFKFTKAVEETY